MLKNIKSIITSLILLVLSCYLIWGGYSSLFVGNVVEYTKFKEFVLNKKIKRVYIANNKARFFEYFRIGPKTRSKQCETFIEREQKSNLLNFLEENNIQL